MENSGLISALSLDKQGGATKISLNQIDTNNLKDKLIWLHFNFDNQDTINWIKNSSNLDNIAINALLKEAQRPRKISLDDALVICLKGINLNQSSQEDEDMISIRVYLTKNLIITTRKQDIVSISDIIKDLQNKKGPKNSTEFFLKLIKSLTIRMENSISNLEERIDILEEKTIAQSNIKIGNEISNIRIDVHELRKYLIPQKEALNNLYLEEDLTHMSKENKLQFKEVINQITRYIEELDSIKEKSIFLQEEFRNNLSEQMNNKIYILSIISAIFLPLGFLTGLLGINVGGVPGSEDKSAFYIFVGILIVIGIIQFILFKKKKWI